MKRNITLTYIVVSLCNIAIAQTTSNTCPPTTKTQVQQNQTCEDGKGITTNPSNPANTECPVLINNFDWKLKQPISGNIIEEKYDVYDGDGFKRNIINPFNDNDNNNEYIYLALKQNSNYYPEDGWELLKVDFGTLGNIGLGINEDPGRNTDVIGPRLPYMILYNKYSGTFRFFGSLLGQFDGYKTIRIELRIPEKSPNYPASPNVYQFPLKATNLLSIQGDAVQPLDQETDENVMVVFAKATNNPNQFFWFDIPVAYDPCLCNIRSQLDITFAFVKTANINLNGTIDGAIKTETKDDGSGPTAVKVATTVIAAGVSTVLAVKTGGAVINFQAYADLVKLFKYIPGLSDEQQENLEKLGNYVDCGAKFAKVIHGNYSDVVGKDDKKAIKAGNNILDANTTFLSSLASGCDKKDNGATTINATANLSGSWTEETNIGGTEIKLAMPGSKWDDRKRFIRSHTDTENDNKTIAAYPTYNERLGTFALLETPVVNISQHYFTEVRITNQWPISSKRIMPTNEVLTKVNLESDLKYTLNPLMNLNMDETEIYCRFVVKENDGLDLDDLSFWFNVDGYYKKASGPLGPIYDRTRSSSWLGINFPNFDTRLNTVFVPNSKYPINSDFLPINQFKNMIAVFPSKVSSNYIGNFQNIYLDNIYLQIKIVAKSNDIGTQGNNQSMFIYTYPVKFNIIPGLNSPNVEYDKIHNEEPTKEEMQIFINGTYMPKLRKMFLDNIIYTLKSDKNFTTNQIFTDDETFAYDGIVTISANLSTIPGKKV